MAASSASALPKSPLTNAQLEILALFQREVPEKVILEMRRVYIRYLADKITADVDQTFEENGWGDGKIEEWKNTHMRTPYNPE